MPLLELCIVQCSYMFNFWFITSINEATDLSRCVPLIFHQDDGEAHRRRSFMVTTFGSALVHKSPWDSRFLLYCTDNSKSCSNTYDTLDTWIAWSFTELGAGRWLQHSPWGEYMGRREDKAGTLIADGWIGVLVAHRGDEKALAKAFHVKNTWVSEEVCFSCRASRLSDSRYLYTAFGQNAPHRETIVDLHTFVTSKVGPNAWTRVPGFHPSMIAYDWLHVLDLALIPDAAASVPRLHFCIIPLLALTTIQTIYKWTIVRVCAVEPRHF